MRAERALWIAAGASLLLHGWFIGGAGLLRNPPPVPLSLHATVQTRWVSPSGAPVAAPEPVVALAEKHEQKQPLAHIESNSSAINSVAKRSSSGSTSHTAAARIASSQSTQPAQPTQPIRGVPATSPSAPVAAAAAATSSLATAAPSERAERAASSTAVSAAVSASLAPSASLQLPAPTQVSYRLRHTDAQGQVREGTGRLIWRHDGERYELRLQAEAGALTLLTQISRGRIGASGLEPERFSDRRLRRAEQAVHFQREREQISFSNNSPDVPLQAGAQDRLSVLMQLTAWLAAQPTSTPVSVQVASLSEADVWTFSPEAPGFIELGTGAQPMEAIALVRAQRRVFDDRLELWLAPALGYWPVRIRLVQPGGGALEWIWQP